MALNGERLGKDAAELCHPGPRIMAEVIGWDKTRGSKSGDDALKVAPLDSGDNSDHDTLLTVLNGLEFTSELPHDYRFLVALYLCESKIVKELRDNVRNYVRAAAGLQSRFPLEAPAL
jgi:hypothetical protein